MHKNDEKNLTDHKMGAMIFKRAKKAHIGKKSAHCESFMTLNKNHAKKEVDRMGSWSFVGMILLMFLALFVGLRASAARKRTLRESILQNRAELTAVAELIRQKKNYQAENLLIQRGNNRAAARTVVVLIRELLKNGEWDRA